MDDDEGADVIRLPRPFEPRRHARDADLDDLPIRSAERDYSKPQCRHRKTVVDLNARIVSCRTCGAPLDPIGVLADLASRYEVLVREGMALSHRVDGLRSDLAELEREERNAKARIRSARKRRDDGDAVEAALRAMFDGRRWTTFESLPASLQEDHRRRIRPVLEAYLGALDDGEQEAQTA